MKGRVEAVVGTQWGDEGKGRVSDAIGAGFDVFARYQGGANSGHTVIINGKRFVFHLLPTGMLRPCKMCVIGNGVMIDPGLLLSELKELQDRGEDRARLLVSDAAHVVLPYHKTLDRARDSLRGRGRAAWLCGEGMDSACVDKYSRRGIRVEDLLDAASLREKMERNLDEANTYLVKVCDLEPLPFHSMFEEALSWGKALAPYVGDASSAIGEAIAEGKGVLLEGAQGTLLDVDHGSYPYVANSSPIAAGGCVGLGIGPSMVDRVIGVVKAYCTRGGEGPFPTEEEGPEGDRLQERGAEYDALTGGRPRRCGWLDLPALRYSMRINGVSSLALAKLDVLTGMESVPVCTAYMIDGAETPDYPGACLRLRGVLPLYERLEGWKDDISSCVSFEELPIQARRYVEFIEEAAGARVNLIGVGPGRGQTIIRSR